MNAADRRLEHLTSEWFAQPGDRLVLLSREAQRLWTVEDLQMHCANTPDTQALATTLVERTIRHNATSAASIVITWPTHARDLVP